MLLFQKTTKQLATQRNSDCFMRVSSLLFVFQILLLLPLSAARENPLPILHKVQTTCEWPKREVATKVSTRFFSALFSIYEGPQQVFRDPEFPLLEARDSGFKSKIGQDSGLKVCARVRMPERTLGITRLHEILGRKYGIEEPYSGPSIYF